MIKREYGAAALLALLLILSFWNIQKVDELSALVGIELGKSQSAAENLDFKSARNYLSEGLNLWQEERAYAHIFLRHSEVDATTEAFYELKQVLMQEDVSACAAAYELLRYRLECISAMEHPSLGSIF